VDNEAATATDTKVILVDTPPAENQPPVANFEYTPKSPVKIGTLLSFVDTSTDADGNIVSRSWDFDDGTSANGSHPVHIYNASGSYNVTLTVTDNDEDTDSYTKTIKIEKDKTEEANGISGFEIAILVGGLAVALMLIRKRRPNQV
jgi:PKD repeat protein